jgi:competence protein CoiA-like protein
MAGNLRTWVMCGSPTPWARTSRWCPCPTCRAGKPAAATAPACQRPLLAKKGDILAHHFAHEGDHSCQGAYESTIHQLAKEIIGEDKGLNIPPVIALHKDATRTVFETQWFAVNTVEIEPWRDGIRPDIIARCGPRELACAFR